MVNIELPIHIGVDPLNSSIEVLGIALKYSENPIHLTTHLPSAYMEQFRTLIQFKEGDPQDTVSVSILDVETLVATISQIFQHIPFETDMSVEQPFINHLSEGLAVELSKSLGLNAIASQVQIPATQMFYDGLSYSLVSNMDSSPLLLQLLYEQFLLQSPERFSPGSDAEYAPIPFDSGDTLSFFVVLRFDNCIINSNPALRLTDLIDSALIPVVKFAVRLSFL